MIQVASIQVIPHELFRDAHLSFHLSENLIINVHGRMILGDRAIVRVAKPLLSIKTGLVKIVDIYRAKELIDAGRLMSLSGCCRHLVLKRILCVEAVQGDVTIHLVLLIVVQDGVKELDPGMLQNL